MALDDTAGGRSPAVRRSREWLSDHSRLSSGGQQKVGVSAEAGPRPEGQEILAVIDAFGEALRGHDLQSAVGRDVVQARIPESSPTAIPRANWR